MIFAFAAVAQTGDDPGRLLRDATGRVLETVERLPNYVCTETIARYRYQPDSATTENRSCDDIAASAGSGKGRQRLFYSDRLRFDVAVNHDPSAPDGEMYSWAGADRFSNRDVFELVDGAMSTGSFSSMLASIFGGPAARFSYNGDVTEGEKTFAEFGFRVAEEASAYYYVFGKGRANQARVPYDGSFLVDGTSHDMVRLVVRAFALPPQSRSCELTRTVNYGRTRLHEADFLLPTEARVTLVHTDGSIAENIINYSGCREFHGDSTVRFDAKAEPLPTAGGAPAATEPPALPAALPFTIVLTQGIDPATAAAGDAVEAKLKTPIRTRSTILVREGATIHGRIVSIRRYYQQGAKESKDRAPLVIALRLESWEDGSVRRPLKAGPDPGLQRFVKLTGSLSARVDMGPLNQLQDSDTAVFEVRGANVERGLQIGLESNWRTLER
jgi:hypothetical protein